MDLWKQIETDIGCCYNDSIRNVFLDSVASSTPARQVSPEHYGNDDPSLLIDLSVLDKDLDLGSDRGEHSPGPVIVPELGLDENFATFPTMSDPSFDQMIDQILNEIDLNNTDSVVAPSSDLAGPGLMKVDLRSPSPLAESTPKKKAVSLLNRPHLSSASVASQPKLDQSFRRNQAISRNYTSSSDLNQHNLDYGYSFKFNFAGLSKNDKITKKVKTGQKKLRQQPPVKGFKSQQKLVSVLKPFRVPDLTIGNYFSNFSPDVTTIRKLDRYKTFIVALFF